MKRLGSYVVATSITLTSGGTARAADWTTAPQTAPASAAQLLGARAFVDDISLSPDGKRAVFVTPGKGSGTVRR